MSERNSATERSSGKKRGSERSVVAREGREAIQDLNRFLTAARRTWRDGEDVLRGELASRPWVAIGAAAAAGYVLGAGVPVWLARSAAGMGARLALMAVLQEKVVGDAPAVGDGA